MRHWQINPEIVGRSSSLRRAVIQAIDAVEQGCHLLIEGEAGSGRRLLARSAWARCTPQDRCLLTVDCQMFGNAAVEALLFGGPSAPRGIHGEELLQIPLTGGLLLLRGEAMLRNTQLRLAAALRAASQRPPHARLQIVMICEPLPDACDTIDRALANNMVRVCVPALRDRSDDIPAIVESFLHNVSPYERMRCSHALMERFRTYSWPGNVTELRTVLRRLMLQPHSGILDVRHLADMTLCDESCFALLHDMTPAPGTAPMIDVPLNRSLQ